MRKSEALKHFGSQQGIASALRITLGAVSQWGDVIPEGSAYKLQVITGGALQVDPAEYKHRPKRGQTLAHDAASSR